MMLDQEDIGDIAIEIYKMEMKKQNMILLDKKRDKNRLNELLRQIKRILNNINENPKWCILDMELQNPDDTTRIFAINLEMINRFPQLLDDFIYGLQKYYENARILLYTREESLTQKISHKLRVRLLFHYINIKK